MVMSICCGHCVDTHFIFHKLCLKVSVYLNKVVYHEKNKKTIKIREKSHDQK